MSLEKLINQAQPPLLSLLTVCLNHPQAHVRQSAYALVGDMVIHCFCVLRPHIPGIMGKLILQLDPEPKFEFIAALNNAAWSVGEVALRYGKSECHSVIPHLLTNPTVRRRIPTMGRPADFKAGSNPTGSKGTKKLARKCSRGDRTNRANAPDRCRASLGRVCGGIVSGLV